MGEKALSLFLESHGNPHEACDGMDATADTIDREAKEKDGDCQEGSEGDQSQSCQVDNPSKNSAEAGKGVESRGRAGQYRNEDQSMKIPGDFKTEEEPEEEVESSEVEAASDEPVAEDQSLQEKIIGKVRSKPALLGSIVGVILGLLMLSSAISGTAKEGVEALPSAEAGEVGYPVPEAPEGRVEPFESREVRRMLDESEKRAGERQEPTLIGFRSERRDVEVERKERLNRLEALRKKKKGDRKIGKGRRRRGRKKKSAGVNSGSTQAEGLKPGGQEEVPPVHRRPPRGAGFYKAGVTISASSGKKSGEKPLIPPGTSFSARLKVGVSTDFAGATVLAEVLEPVGDGKSLVLPKGSLIKGRMRGAGDRIYIDFHTAVAGGKKTALKGYAVTGKLPGIPAKVSGGPGAEETSRTGSVLSRGSLRTAQGVVGTLGGDSVTGQLVRNVAGESLNEVRQDVNERTQRTLELPSGVEFTIVITD